MQPARTIILNNAKDSTFKAIVNLKSSGKSDIKFFNFGTLPKNLAIGIKQDKKVVKIPLNIAGNGGDFETKDINLDSKILCAVVNVSNPFCPEILLSGSQNTPQTNSNIESAFVQAKPKDTSTLYEEDSLDSLENLIDKNLEEDEQTTYYDACAGCKYREAFYKEGGSVCYKKPPHIEKKQDLDENKKDFTPTISATSVGEKDIKENVVLEQEKAEEQNFYEQVKSQIDTLFNKYEPCDELSQVIPSSKWVKIVYDKEGNFYVLGLIFDESGKVLYICYGMPAKNPNTPPDELEEYAVFIPKNIAYPDGEGFFVVCQDGATGQTLKIDLI